MKNIELRISDKSCVKLQIKRTEELLKKHNYIVDGKDIRNDLDEDSEETDEEPAK